MKIVMLSGESHCGKTTTLNLVYDRINPTQEEILEPKTQLGGDPKDFECMIKRGEKVMAFFTMGDYSRDLLAAFKKYNAKNCDFLVCACNKRFKKPYKRIEDYPNKVICKTIADDPNSPAACEFANSKDRDCILKHLPV